MDTTTDGQATDGRSHPSRERGDLPVLPRMTEAARQACDSQYREDGKPGDQPAKNTALNKNTATSGQANNGQASRFSNAGKGVRIPPGMTEETWLAIRQAKIRQYWEEKKLADETAKNTELNKNIPIGNQTYRSTELNKNVKCNSTKLASLASSYRSVLINVLPGAGLDESTASRLESTSSS